MNEAVAAFPGYISAVVIPPVRPLQSDWVMVQRFRLYALSVVVFAWIS